MSGSGAVGDFKDFERTGWGSVVAPYDAAFGDLTTQAIGPLLDAVGAGPGVRLLDVATGPGYVAGQAAGRGAMVTAVDLAAPMVGEARRRNPGLDVREADAEALPFEAAAFDAVVMNFGMLHLGDPERAIGEAHRVLRPGGRFAFTVWAPPEESVGFDIVLRAVERHGNSAVDLPTGPPFFRFSDVIEARRVMRAAGFRDIQAVRVSQTWRLPDLDALFEGLRTGTVRTAGLLAMQTPKALAAIRAAVAEAVRVYERDGRFEVPMPAILASGRK